MQRDLLVAMLLMTKRRFQAMLSLLLTALLAGCGGGGGGGSSALSALPAVQATPMPLTIVSNSGGVLDLTATVVAMISGGFQVQGGKGVGYLHIYVNSSTIISGPSPFVGENVEVVGPGSPSTSVTATSVKQLGASPSPAPSAVPTPSPTPTSTPLTQVVPAAVGSPLPMPSGAILQTGQIGAVSGGKLTIQAGPGCGWINVYATSSTDYLDGAAQVGQYAAVTGTGARCVSITSANALSISRSAFTSSVTTGTVEAATSYGFKMTSNGAEVPVALNSSTVVFGATLAIGSQVTVTALGTTATGLHATQIAVQQPATPSPDPSASPSPTPAPISMAHVQTFAYIYGYAGVPTTVPVSSMTPYVNWSMTDTQHAATLRSAGIKVQVYANFWRNYTSDNPLVGYTDLAPGGAHAGAEAKDCSGSAIYDTDYGGGYESDARSSAALAHAQVVANYRLGEYTGAYDALFSDDSGAVWGIPLPCGYSQATYDQAVNAVHAALGVPTWINALGAAPDPSTAVDLVQPANVLGAMCEMCYTLNGSSGDAVQTGPTWLNVENAEIGTIAQRKVFWDYARATGSASGETGLRLYAYASFLLSYDPSYAMFQEALSTASRFPVMPETGLVAMSPLTTAGSVSGYQAAGGAYFREFGACYYRTAFVGRCAVAINPNASTVPVPTTSYGHSMVLTGAGVLDGGTVDFAGSQVSQLAPGSAAILFP